MRRLINPTQCLVQALDRHAKLSSTAAAQLENLCGRTEGFLSGDHLDLALGPPRPLLVVAGWAAELCTLADGRRQVLRIALPGEVCGVGDRPPRGGFTAEALTDVTVADLSQLQALVGAQRVDRSLIAAWRNLQGDQYAGDLRQLVRLGSLSAIERTGHLLLELYERSAFAGLTHGAVMPLPLTQIQLAHHLGLSSVHANRVLQQLRREGLIELRSHLVIFRKLAELAAHSCYELGSCAAAPAEVPARMRV